MTNVYYVHYVCTNRYYLPYRQTKTPLEIYDFSRGNLEGVASFLVFILPDCNLCPGFHKLFHADFVFKPGVYGGKIFKKHNLSQLSRLKIFFVLF